MKKIVSIILMLAITLSMFSSVSAATIADKTSYVPNPMDLLLSVTVGSKLSGTGGDFVYPPEDVSFVVGAYEKKGVDYKARLNMEPLRALFGEGYIQHALPNDAEAMAEFNNGTVNTTVNVLVEYPASAMIATGVNLASASVGVLDAGSIFVESAREVTSNSVKVTYVNQSGLKVSELTANVDSYLKDIEFTLNDVISYSEAGNHIVKITLSGETLLDFESKDQRVIYSGSASNVVNVSKDGNILNHELVSVPAVSATCFEAGKTEAIICKTHNSYGDCGALGTKMATEIPALNHMLGGQSLKVFVNAVSATCKSKGMAEHWTCSLCKSDFDSEESNVVQEHEKYVLPLLPHTEEELDAISATCTTVGLTAGKKCTVCSKITVAQKIIPALGHDTVVVPAVAANCTDPGKTEGLVCIRDNCPVEGGVLIAQNETPALGHKFGGWVIVREATETEKGLMERTCTVEGCDVKETKEIEKKPHVCVPDESLSVIISEPTCTEKGLKQAYCSCGKPVGEPEVIPVKAHSTVFVPAIASTCVAEGIVEHYTCVFCGENFRDSDAKNPINSIKAPLNKNNHGDDSNIVTITGVAPTCARQGLTDGAKCKNCGLVTVAQELIPLAAHTFETIPASPATCEQHGVKEHKHCAVCNKDFDMTGEIEWTLRDFDIPALGHNYGPSEKYPEDQVAVDGHFDGIKTCLNGCGATIDVKIAATPEICTHLVTFEIIVKPATCTETGKKDIVCVSCGDLKEFELPMTLHTLERVETVPATCHTKGTASYYICTECGKMFSGADASTEITEPPVLDELTHVFREIGNGNNKQCIYCKEVIHVKKKDKEGNTDNTDNIIVDNPNHVGIKEEQDIIKEESHADIDDKITIVPEIIIAEREEVSPKLDEAIIAHVGEVPEDTTILKAAWEIEIEKVTTYENSGDVDREPVKEINDLISITIKIPDELKNSVDFLVHRLHADEDGQEHTDIITTTPNEVTGEYIEIDLTAGIVVLWAKRFSEYALVGYGTKVNEDPVLPGGGGSGGSNFAITFKANGGTSVDGITAHYGDTIKAPVSTREGYILEGWYTDAALTKKFDFKTPITHGMTLYAKWIEAGDSCMGEFGNGCPSLKYGDVDTSAWYHKPVDYVLDHGLMVGVANGVFAPNGNITRGMVATVLGRREGIKDTDIVEKIFDDVDPDIYYASHIAWAEENNIVEGYGNGNYGPDDFITREQMAAIIHRYITYKNYELEGEIRDTSYADNDSISDWAKDSVTFCYSKGIMQGKDGNKFDPLKNATRAEFAAVMMRTFK